MRNYSQKLTAGIFYTGLLEYQALRMLRGRYHVRLVGCTFPNLILLPLPANVTPLYRKLLVRKTSGSVSLAREGCEELALLNSRKDE
jgi:hypothetical protein